MIFHMSKYLPRKDKTIEEFGSRPVSTGQFSPTIPQAGLLLPTFLVSILFCSNLTAGSFTGLETDKDNSKITFIGGQTDGQLFYHFFAGQLQYEYTDSNQLVKADTDMLTVAVGYRLGDQQNYAIALGATYNEKTETSNAVQTTEEKTGGFVQFSAASYTAISNSELIASYSSIDRFIWSRARYKYKLTSGFEPGAEIFWMGNNDADSYGVGLLMGMDSKVINVGIKVGYKQTTNNNQSVYSGIEFYIPL